jgi:isopenicillin N synthase-like dioxygenase
MNIGDMFEHISNRLYPSAMHRVVGNKTSTARYSIPVFVCPRVDEQVKPQPSRVAKDAMVTKFEPVTYAEYSQMELDQISVR